MKPLAALTLVSLLCVATRPVHAEDGGTGFRITPVAASTTGCSHHLMRCILCSLAQNTGRNAWLWFFLGAAFSVIALAVLLYKNAEGRRPASNSQRPAEPGAAPDGGDT